MKIFLRNNFLVKIWISSGNVSVTQPNYMIPATYGHQGPMLTMVQNGIPYSNGETNFFQVLSWFHYFYLLILQEMLTRVL